MKKYQRRILVSVTGMSPAIVTETLYALVVDKKFIPTEIRVITTEQGKNKILTALLGIESGTKKYSGALEEFIQDYGAQYGIEQIHFDESCITVIENDKGEKLSDIRTPEENITASNQIVRLVGELCKDEKSALHVSIAGGRKTMGFFMGYALSLYGREQDSLSHVLVSEQFESLPNFFYPKPQPYFINDSKGKEIDASQAEVMLAEIPWVRLGLGVSQELLNNQISYCDSVTKAQEILEKPTLTFLAPVDDRIVLFGKTPIKLSPRGYSLLLSLVIAKQRQTVLSASYSQEPASKALYSSIYHLFKAELEAEDFRGILNDSRTDINKKVRKAFSLSKEMKTPYIPSSVNYSFELFIDLENIDISAITEDLKHIL
ncbi:CRISPR-associated ring nuclease Csm6 [Pasteurella sp. PK-2025]|uniref:CRISPR-associated ring nuclease Csm6 n=1 Tax=Pasteurella sp. PK-2025 TaxID=3413133 RepID=UPI003C70BF44